MGFKARRGAADCFHLCVKVQSARGQTGQLNRRQQKTSRRYGARAGGRSRRLGTFPAARARARTTPRGVRSSPVSAVCPPVRPLGEAEARRVNSIHAATVTAPSRARARARTAVRTATSARPPARPLSAFRRLLFPRSASALRSRLSGVRWRGTPGETWKPVRCTSTQSRTRGAKKSRRVRDARFPVTQRPLAARPVTTAVKENHSGASVGFNTFIPLNSFIVK